MEVAGGNDDVGQVLLRPMGHESASCGRVVVPDVAVEGRLEDALKERDLRAKQRGEERTHSVEEEGRVDGVDDDRREHDLVAKDLPG